MDGVSVSAVGLGGALSIDLGQVLPVVLGACLATFAVLGEELGWPGIPAGSPPACESLWPVAIAHGLGNTLLVIRHELPIMGPEPVEGRALTGSALSRRRRDRHCCDVGRRRRRHRRRTPRCLAPLASSYISPSPMVAKSHCPGKHDGVACGRPYPTMNTRAAMAAAPEWVPENVWAKLDTSLRREIVAVHGRPAAELPVLVIVGSGPPSPRRRSSTASGDRVAVVAAAQAEFDREARPVLDRIATLGARDVRPLWISHAIAASLAPSALIAVADLPQVHRLLLDAPRKVGL